MMAQRAWVDSGGYRQPFSYNFVVFVDNACHALLTDRFGNSDTAAGFEKLSAEKTTQQIKEVLVYMYIERHKYWNYIIVIWTHPGRQNVDWPSVRFLPLSCSMLPPFDVVTLWRCSELISTKVVLRQHLFGPKSQNAIINSERKRLFWRVEGGDVNLTLYRLTVITGWAKPQVGGGIAWAWIEGTMVYPGISMPRWWRFGARGYSGR